MQAVGLMLAFAVGPYAGSQACLQCHKDAAAQLQSNHARSLRPIVATGLPAVLSERPVRERNGAEIEYQPAGESLKATARVRGDAASALLEWAFGAGVQAYTLVGRAGGKYFEHRISFYTAQGYPGLTMGHPAAAASATAALGIMQPDETIARCFGCHATGVRKAGEFSEAGVTCERCHGPGASHAASQGREKLLNPGRYSAAASVQICAECHRSPEPAQRRSLHPEADDPVSIRFQPIGLMASRCFQSSGKLSCLTCHNPHENARRNDAAFYSAKCKECHQTTGAKCPRATQGNCLPCHMKASSPVPYLTFTDHRIR